MDAAQHIVAGGQVGDDDPEGIKVENLVQGLLLGVHFAVDGVDMLHPAVDMAVDALCVHPLLYLPLDAGQKFLVGGGPGRQGLSTS